MRTDDYPAHRGSDVCASLRASPLTQNVSSEGSALASDLMFFFAQV